MSSIELYEYESKQSDAETILNVAYLLIFVFGFTGNIYAIQMVVRVLVFNSKHHASSTSYKNFAILILVLCIIDLIVMCLVVVMVLDSYVLDWSLGEFMCKIFWTIDNFNKIGSRIVLMVVSVVRAASIKFPHHLKSLTIRRSVFLLSATLAVLVLCVLPIFLHTTIVHVQLVDGDMHNNQTNVRRCMVLFPDKHAIPYTLVLFVFGFCTPTIVILLSYIFIIQAGWSRYGKTPSNGTTSTNNTINNQRRRSLIKLTVLSAVSMLLYMVCWLPFWLLTLVISFQNIEDTYLDGEESMFSVPKLFTFLVHPLVYINSAVNWIIYILANRELRKQYKGMTEMQQQRKSCSFMTPNVGKSTSSAKGETDLLVVEKRRLKTGSFREYLAPESRRVSVDRLRSHSAFAMIVHDDLCDVYL